MILYRVKINDCEQISFKVYLGQKSRRLIIYNMAIKTVASLYKLTSWFQPKAKAFVLGQKNAFDTLTKFFHSNTHPVIWVHCASLGEFEQGRPVIEALKKEYPQFKILLSFFSPSGYEVKKNYASADCVTYLPWDTEINATRFIEITRPCLAIFVKYEFWHNYSVQLKKKNIPLLSISCIFREDQIYFKSYGSFFRKTLTNFNHFFVQNHESLKLLESIGIKETTLTGDTRFDRVHQIIQQAEEIPIALNFKADQKTMVIGSCWPEDLAVLTPLINEGKLKFILAPHEPEEEFLSEIEKELQVKVTRFSKADSTISQSQVLLIDNIGMLSRLYRYGEFAYVGGAFNKGLHNILEAACYGVPIFFGNKNYEKFKEATDLIKRGGAFEVGSYTDLKTTYELLNTKPESFLLACEVTRQYVIENLGATRKIIDYCKKYLAL